MDLLLKDKNILVTGGSSGLGFACAKSIAEECANVVLVSRNVENLQLAAQNIEKITGKSCAYFSADLSDALQINKLAEDYFQKFETIDGLILNAGGPPAGKSQEFEDTEWQEAVNTTFMSVVRLCRLFVPKMQNQKYGRIVAIESSSVKQIIDNLALSNSIRPAVVGYLKTLSSEVGADNVLINTLLPGPTNTERLQSLLEKWAQAEHSTKEEVTEMRTAQIPLKRFGEPEEFAALATFLISGKNTYVTGQSIAVDGGFTKTLL